MFQNAPVSLSGPSWKFVLCLYYQEPFSFWHLCVASRNTWRQAHRTVLVVSVLGEQLTLLGWMEFLEGLVIELSLEGTPV